MTVAGIDFSSFAVDVVLLDEDTDAASWHRFELTGQDAFDRTREVRAAMPDPSFWDDVLACGIEQPQARGPRAANIGALYRIQGAVLACLPCPLLVQPLLPSSWRKTVGLKGNATKLEVSVFADGVWANPPDDLPFDATDAYCIALAIRMLLCSSNVEV